MPSNTPDTPEKIIVEVSNPDDFGKLYKALQDTGAPFSSEGSPAENEARIASARLTREQLVDIVTGAGLRLKEVQPEDVA